MDGPREARARASSGPTAGAKAPGRGEASSGNGAAPGGSCGASPISVRIVRGDEVEVESIEWLWDGWLARAMFHIVAGSPDTGKSTIALTVAAAVTTGGRLPDGTKCPTGDVLVWSGEDNTAKTMMPRFLSAGGDPRRFHIVSGALDHGEAREFDPATDIPALLTAARAIPNLAFIIVDPVVSAVLGDGHKNTEVRRALQPLVRLATELDAAVLGISHFTKGTAGHDPVERVTRSVAFGALPRVVMAAAKVIEADGERRIFCRAKSNIGPDTGGWDYKLDLVGVPGAAGITAIRVQWGEALEGSARDLLAEAEAAAYPEERSEMGEAEDWLRALLANGPVGSKEIRLDARQAGIAWRTVERAKTRLGVKARKASFSGAWRWSLPDHSDSEGDPVPTPVGGLGGLGKSESLESSCGAGPTQDRQGVETVGGLGQKPCGTGLVGDCDAQTAKTANV